MHIECELYFGGVVVWGHRRRVREGFDPGLTRLEVNAFIALCCCLLADAASRCCGPPTETFCRSLVLTVALQQVSTDVVVCVRRWRRWQPVQRVATLRRSARLRLSPWWCC